MAKRMQTENANTVSDALISLGTADALKSASDDEIWNELDEKILQHRSIEKDGRRKNLKTKESDLAEIVSIIIAFNCELLQRHNSKKTQRDIDAMKLVLAIAAARNASKSPIMKTGTVIPIGLRPKSRPV